MNILDDLGIHSLIRVGTVDCVIFRCGCQLEYGLLTGNQYVGLNVLCPKDHPLDPTLIKQPIRTTILSGGELRYGPNTTRPYFRGTNVRRL